MNPNDPIEPNQIEEIITSFIARSIALQCLKDSETTRLAIVAAIDKLSLLPTVEAMAKSEGIVSAYGPLLTSAIDDLADFLAVEVLIRKDQLSETTPVGEIEIVKTGVRLIFSEKNPRRGLLLLNEKPIAKFLTPTVDLIAGTSSFEAVRVP